MQTYPPRSPYAGFDWDDGNRGKCQKHGVPIAEIEALFASSVVLLPEVAHSVDEQRFRAIGRTPRGRHIFVVFAIRKKEGSTYIRPISARYMHRTEVEQYEEENPELSDRRGG
jgi:uncharacterized DUF497 family protein